MPAHLRDQVLTSGFAIVPAAEMRDHLGAVSMRDFSIFADSWNALDLDQYMADGGHYRRRRHAVFRLKGETLQRLPHQPHYQSRDYNSLNGGIERWFSEVKPETAANPTLSAVVTACRAVFALDPDREYRLEMHQFRIEASPGETGQPTPEGMHRDGVDWVCVMLIDRVNLEQGVTQIARPDGAPLGAFTLSAPMDAVFIDDHRVMHGVTAVTPADPRHPGYRDVLVLTFKIL
jgi:hypothetical protein